MERNTTLSIHITDEQLDEELQSGRGKYPKFVTLMTDKNFKKEARQYVLENGYAKGRTNLTLHDFTSCVNEKKPVNIGTSTASCWLHDMG